MERQFDEILSILDSAFHRLVEQVPAPQKQAWKDGWVYRYKEKTIHQAIILKLARMISGLRAALVLLENGFVQEQAMLQRVLDEIGEDILFLTYALTNDTTTDLHRRYLDEFFQEEFEEHLEPIDSPQKRNRVPGRKIRAYNARIAASAAKQAGQKSNPSNAIQVIETISKAYSGYVHASSTHVMDMYCGDPPEFHLDGMLGTPRTAAHTSDLWNYFYRGLLSAVGAARAFGDKECADYVYENVKRIEKEAGIR